VEQKNGAIVRQVVGYDRLVGDQAYRQLTEPYRALRLYVNCFQPSMKLLSKQRDGKRVRCVYDPAKTPLQRSLLSEVLPAQKQQELIEVAHALDPIRVFWVGYCIAGTLPDEGSVSDPAAGLHALYREQERRKRVLGWRRTHKDPFEGEWERIMFWLIVNPERSSGDIFRDLQRLSPGRGRYQPLRIHPLQRGMRKIRAHLGRRLLRSNASILDVCFPDMLKCATGEDCLQESALQVIRNFLIG
jgi:hypothetical protein